MANIRVRKETGKLFLDFRYRSKRCREQTALDDTPANRRKLKKVLEKIEAEMTLGSFEYARYFPNSPLAEEMSKAVRQGSFMKTPLFEDFAETWLGEMRIQWRDSHYETVSHTFKKHLMPVFGDKEVGHISKADILNFRSSLAKVPGRNNGFLSATRINHILTPLRMILNEAADRFDFVSPYRGIKSLNPREKYKARYIQQLRQLMFVHINFHSPPTRTKTNRRQTGRTAGAGGQHQNPPRRCLKR